MRVITGFAKGRKLKCPSGRNVRPTSDRVKEALYNILGSKVIDCIFLDIFAGTGNIGIEALSRGAKFCCFVDNDNNSIKYIRENLTMLNLSKNSVIIQKDVSEALEIFKENRTRFDIIFIDPPYYNNLIEEPLKKISTYKLLNEDGLIIAEHHKNDILRDTYDTLRRIRIQKYGETILSFYKEEI